MTGKVGSMAVPAYLKRTAKKTGKAFRKPQFTASLKDIDNRKRVVPAAPGIYGWYFREVPEGIPTKGCANVGGIFSNVPLLYVGISDNMHRRIVKFHYGGRESNSTLRKKLRRILALSEDQLSDWLRANALVYWLQRGGGIIPDDFDMGEIGDVEKLIVREELSLPLNAEHNSAHPFHEKLCQIMRG